jgi:ribonuclease Z
MLDTALVGTGGMMPLPNRFLTSMALRFNGRMLMVDCGECTQVSLKLLGWGFKNIEIICYTHFHADHIAGLPGLLLTIGNSDRTEPLRLVGPCGLRTVVESLCVIAQEIPFPLEIIEIPYHKDASFSELTLGEFLIRACPVDHRIPCFAYSFEFKRAGRFDVDRAKKNDVPMSVWNRLQKNEPVVLDGRVFTPDMVLGTPRKSIKVSYCTDTRPTAALPEFVSESDLFICEGLYGELDKLPKTASHKHMIFQEAATIAKKGFVKELWLTHFSPAMPVPEMFINSAREIFSNAYVGKDRMTKIIRYEDTENIDANETL